MMWRRSSQGDDNRAGSTAGLVAVLRAARPEPWSYLEIGVASGETFRAVSADRRVGVDPYPDDFALPRGATLHRCPSRDYFAGPALSQEGPFDVIFVDGLHLWEAALEDALSAFDWLNPEGFVVIDDVFPSGRWESCRAETYEDAVAQARADGQEHLSAWMGDVWKVVLTLTHADVPSLDWATVQITKNRFHTVFWWNGERDTRSVRRLISPQLLEQVDAAPVESLGGFTLQTMPDWYRFEAFPKISERIGRHRG